MVRKITLMLLVFAAFASYASAEIYFGSTTISGTAATTATFSPSISGLVDDIYVAFPGADGNATVKIRTNTLGDGTNPPAAFDAYSGTATRTTAVQENRVEINGVDTWITPGSVVTVGLDRSSSTTLTTVEIILFYDPKK